ncbi:oxygenase MpaB family protein [Paraliomyxa miuraensis]|uniref:oxygenase MpaB family protein n=1 Tax=Paraliomyxa miuraensis TaxID=376150 RepID=UPI00225A5ECD|nr:oxygenase MpaB family protein [Paraliomyxa miuraensis]MCX4240436.1 DUF2236 domain-containing protein [Paraliomyxa miuraensis]
MTGHDWSDALLDALRHQMDPLADEAVRVILASHEVPLINELMRQLSHNDCSIPEELPDPVRDYFERTAVLPSWADVERIRLGEQIFMRYGLQSLQALMFRALPECYASSKGAMVLASTQRLQELTQQRVLETLGFVVDVMSPGGLEPTGRGVRSAQRVRLLHGSIRAHLLAAGRWDAAELGLPINQEDLLGTLASFSALVVDSFDRLGAELSPAEQDAYMHCWNVVGWIMGVREELLFHDYADGLALFQRIRQRHHQRSEHGVALTAALIDYADTLVPGEWLDGVNVSMMRHLCGDEIPDLLQVPEADWTRFVVRQYANIVDLADDIQDHSRMSAKVAERLGVSLMRAVLGSERKGSRPNFAIPQSLHERWGL